MDEISGYARTGRLLLGPGSDLVELQGDKGQRLTAIVFHPEYRNHNAINAALSVVLGFLESPMVTGLAELQAHDRENGAFVYPTGHTWSVAEAIRTLADQGSCGGVRAGVELMHAAGQILIEAAEVGEPAGVYSHGGLTPWRILMDAQGSVQVIGHALPQVEILTFHEDPTRIPREDAFRYCPPERMESRRENFSSDLFGLALIAFELMTGKPVYDGLVNDIRSKAARGETSRRIHQFKEMLPDPVARLLTTALRPDIRDRHQAGGDFLDDVSACLNHPAVGGASLREVMGNVSRYQPRARQDLDPARTSMLSKEELKRLAEEEEPAQKASTRQAFSPVRTPQRAEPAAPPRVEPVAAPPPPSPVAPEAALRQSSLVSRPARSAPRAAEPAAPVDPPRAVEPVRPAGRPPIGVARPPPSRRTSTEEPAPSAPPTEPPRTAEEILARIQSSDSGRPRPTSSADPQELIAQIMQSGSGRVKEAEAPRAAGSVGVSVPARSRPAEQARPAEPPRPPEPPRAPDPPQPVEAARGAEPPRATEPSLERPGRADPGDPMWMARQIEQGAADARAAFAREEADRAAEKKRAADQAAIDLNAPQAMQIQVGGAPKAAVAAPQADRGSVFADAAPAAEGRKSDLPAWAAAAAARGPKPTSSASFPSPAAPSPIPDAPTVRPAPAPSAVPVSTGPTPAIRPAAPAVPPAKPPAPPVATTKPAQPVAAAPPSSQPVAAAPASSQPAKATAAPTPARPPLPILAAAPVAEVDGATQAFPRGARPPDDDDAPAPAPPPALASVRTTPPISEPRPPEPAASSSRPPEPAASSKRPPEPAASAPRLRVPDTVRSGARGDLLALRFARAPGAPPLRRRLPAQTSLAEAVHVLVGSLAPVRLTPDGRLMAWYRLGDTSGPFPADRRLDTCNEADVLVLHPVENRLQWVEVEAEGAGRMRVQVGVAVPVLSLVDGLAQQLDLPAGDWQLLADGELLDPFSILADRGAPMRLHLRRGSA